MTYVTKQDAGCQATTGIIADKPGYSDTLGLLDPSNYITGPDAEITHNLQLFRARQRLGDLCHEWLQIDGVREKKVFFKGTIHPDGSATYRRTKGKGDNRKQVGPELTSDDIRKIASQSGNGVWYLPLAPFDLPLGTHYKLANVLTAEWDTVSSDPSDWQWVKVLNLFAEFGMIPNSITSSGGKCDGLSPHAQWMFETSFTKKELLYLQDVLRTLGADKHVTVKTISLFRKPGFPRHSKGKEQGLFKGHHNNFYDVREFINCAIVIGDTLGIHVPTPLEFYESLHQKEEAAKNSKPLDLSQFDGDDIERLLADIDQQLPTYSKGQGTYGYRFILAGAAKTLLGCSDKARALMPNCFSVQSIGWHSLRPNNSPIGTIVNKVRVWLDNPQWHLPDWWQQLYKKDGAFTAQIKVAIHQSIERAIFSWDSDATHFEGSPEAFLGEIKKIVASDQIALDLSGTGNGKTHRATHHARLVFPTGRVMIITQSPRKFPVKDADTLYTRVLGRNNKVWTQEGTELIPHDLGDSPDNAVKRFYCPLVDKFHAMGDKGYAESVYGGDSSICDSCPNKRICNSQPGWFKYDWRQSLKDGNDLIINPDGIPKDMGADGEQVNCFIDEVETTLNPYDSFSDTKDGLILALEHYADVLGDDAVLNARKVVRALSPAFTNRDAYGLDHQSILDLLKGVPTDGIDDLIAAMPANCPDFSQVINNDWQSYDQDLRKRRDLMALIESEDSLEALKSIPSNTLFYLLQAIRGDQSIYLSCQDGKITVTIHNPNKYHYLNRFKGIVLMSATADQKDLCQSLRLTKPITAIKMGDTQPLKNVTINCYRMAGIKSNRISHGSIKKRLLAVQSHFASTPTICPKRWRQNVDNPSKHSFMEAQGHWMADSRGSNDFEGVQELLVFSLPKPHLGDLMARYVTANGSMDGFNEFYLRQQAQEAIQLAGRPRANRYPNQHFVIHWVIDDVTDLHFLSALGATVTAIPIASIVPDAGSRWEVARQSIIDGIQELKHKGIAATQNKIAKLLGRDQGSLSKLLRRHNVTIESLIDTIERDMSFVIEDSNKKRHNPETKPAKGFWEMLAQLMAIPVDQILGMATQTIADRGWEYFLDGLNDYPVEFRSKILGILATQLSLERDAIAA